MRKLKFVGLVLLALGMTQVAFAQDATATAEATAQTPEQICADAVPAPSPETRQFTQPEQVTEPGIDYRAIFCTDAGPIYVDLLEDYTPITVNNFVFLAEQGYYNNTTFHRVMQDFMAQGGDPSATGMGSPGYTIADEFVGFLHFDRPGWLAMANIGQPNSAGGQFFITTAPYPSLDFGYTIFGEVLEGQDNAAAIKLRNPDTATEPGTALNTVVIVTDPASVITTYEPPAPATRDDISALLDQLTSTLPDQLSVNDAMTGIFETDQVAATAPADLQSAFADFLAKYHHEYRAGHGVTNTACDLQAIPFISMGYTLDRFATPEDAAAALDDGFIAQLAEANGFTSSDVEGLNYPIYTQPTTACDGDAVAAMTVWQRGHFLATISVVFPDTQVAPPEVWLSDLAALRVYEPAFSDILRPEMR